MTLTLSELQQNRIAEHLLTSHVGDNPNTHITSATTRPDRITLELYANDFPSEETIDFPSLDLLLHDEIPTDDGNDSFKACFVSEAIDLPQLEGWGAFVSGAHSIPHWADSGHEGYFSGKIVLCPKEGADTLRTRLIEEHQTNVTRTVIEELNGIAIRLQRMIIPAGERPALISSAGRILQSAAYTR